MRKRISESNLFPAFNLFEEYRKIEMIISEATIVGTYSQFGTPLIPAYTLEQYKNDLYFRGWNLRGTFVSIADMRNGLGIAKAMLTDKSIAEERVLDFLQYAANLWLRINGTIRSCTTAYISDRDNYLIMLIQNITALTNRLGAELKLDKAKSEIYLVYKDAVSFAVAEEHPDISESIIEYRKLDNRGDLQRKGEVLCTLYKKLEAYGERFKGTTYEGLYKDTTFLFNKTGARHWVEKDKIACETFLKMKPDELEDWYDKTFELFLTCMVICSYLDIREDIGAVKRVELR